MLECSLECLFLFLWLQAELVKFQETVLLLQDYYGGMAEAVPAQLPPPARLPLIEVQTTPSSLSITALCCVSDSAGEHRAPGTSFQQHRPRP